MSSILLQIRNVFILFYVTFPLMQPFVVNLSWTPFLKWVFSFTPFSEYEWLKTQVAYLSHFKMSNMGFASFSNTWHWKLPSVLHFCMTLCTRFMVYCLHKFVDRVVVPYVLKKNVTHHVTKLVKVLSKLWLKCSLLVNC